MLSFLKQFFLGIPASAVNPTTVNSGGIKPY